jgi:hypothetical protein
MACGSVILKLGMIKFKNFGCFLFVKKRMRNIIDVSKEYLDTNSVVVNAIFSVLYLKRLLSVFGCVLKPRKCCKLR